MNPVKLYGIPASNAVLTVQLALEHKGIAYRRVDLLPVLHRVGMPLRRFGGVTVPGIVIDGRRVHGSLACLRALDELRTGPPLFPADPLRRREVVNAVSWGEETYQPIARRLLPYALLRRHRAVGSLLEDSRTFVPAGVLARTAAPAILANSRIHRSNDQGVRRMLGELPTMLDRVDAWIASGLLGADDPGAADFMIAPSTRALMWFEDLRPAVESRPAAGHALRLAPRYAGSIPAVFPEDAVASFGESVRLAAA
jgi:glutathione S-transferase